MKFKYYQGILHVVLLPGSVRFKTASLLVRQIKDEIVRTMAEEVVLDLKYMDIIDSSRAMMLIKIKEELVRMDMTFSMVQVNNPAMQVLDIFDLSSFHISA